MPSPQLFVPYHQQDNGTYCGPACLQMVLTSLGTPVEHIFQEDLNNDIQPHSVLDPSPQWFSAPDGMLWTIQQWNPQPESHIFILHEEISEDSISRKIVATLCFFRVAPIALVKDMQHWVVVTGYNTSADPTDFDDVSYAIMGFYVNDPWPPVPRSVGTPHPPPPHWAFDPCGFGDPTVFGLRNQYIVYDEWTRTYMTPVHDGYWLGKYIAICDPKPAPKKQGKRMPIERLYDGHKIIDKKTAGECAMLGIKKHGLAQQEHLRKILTDVTPSDDPMLVESLDRPNNFYYIVPLMTEQKIIHALVCVDARFGNFKQASFASEGKPIKFNQLSREDILKILGPRVELEEEKKVLIVHPELISIYPVPVWKACRESLSPYIPFYLVFINATPIYILPNGTKHAYLHTDMWGI